MPVFFLQLKDSVVAAAIVLLAVEALGLTVFNKNPAAGWGVTFLFLILDTGLLLTLSVWRAARAVHLRRQWVLLSINFALFVVALVLRLSIFLASLNGRHSLLQRIDYTDLLMVFGYIPIFIFLSLPSGKPYPRVFFWIDSIQAFIAGYLLYILLFSVIPFTHVEVRPISGGRLIAFYDFINIAMCVVSILRLYASTAPDERLFYRAYSWFAGATLILLGVYNAVWGQSAVAGDGQLLGVLPGYVLCILITRLPVEADSEKPAPSSNLLTAFLNTASPALLTFCLLALGIDAARTYFVFGMSAVAAAFLLYSLRSTLLQRDYEQSQDLLREARDILQSLSLTDGLTGVANRRCFDQTLESEWSRAARNRYPLSLLLIDVDYFKPLNDRHGHQVGDDCLVRIAKAITAALPRSGDLLARYGGEEFAVILPNTNQSGAAAVAETMRAAVSALQIANETEMGQFVSISVGISAHVHPASGSLQSIRCTPEMLVEAADRALYQAKERGRNRIEMAMIAG